MALPARQQPGEAAQQEVPGAAGRVDHPHPVPAELADGRIERTVQYPGFHEVRRLQQGVSLARVLRQVLVEVAQEARVPVRVGEVVQEVAAARALAEEGQQRHRPVARDGQAEQRVARRVKQAGQARQARDPFENFQQILGVAVVRVGAEVGPLPLPGQLAALPRAGQQRAVQQAIVLQEANEHEGEEPMHRRLVERRGPERLERVGGASGREGRLPLGLDGSPAGGRLVVGAEVSVEPAAQLLEVGQQLLGVYHTLVCRRRAIGPVPSAGIPGCPPPRDGVTPPSARRPGGRCSAKVWSAAPSWRPR